MRNDAERLTKKLIFAICILNITIINFNYSRYINILFYTQNIMIVFLSMHAQNETQRHFAATRIFLLVSLIGFLLLAKNFRFM